MSTDVIEMTGSEVTRVTLNPAIPGTVATLVAKLLEGDQEALPDDLTFADWKETGDLLQTVERNVNWALGKWWLYGEGKWGEEAAQAVGRSVETLRQAAWVYQNVAVRDPDLSWSHHRQVAALEPEQQIKMLDRAKENGLSSHELHREVQAAKKVEEKLNGRSTAAGFFRLRNHYDVLKQAIVEFRTAAKEEAENPANESHAELLTALEQSLEDYERSLLTEVGVFIEELSD